MVTAPIAPVHRAAPAGGSLAERRSGRLVSRVLRRSEDRREQSRRECEARTVRGPGPSRPAQGPDGGGRARLLADAGIRLTFDRRGYRPTISLDGFETKILKPQNIVEMLHLGSRDLGFAGADWVVEKGAELVELVDTALDPVRIVAAAAPDFLDGGARPSAGFVVATEYERITRAWLERRGFDGRVVRSYGATEVFPPEDADCIVDNTATGATLKANGLMIFDELMRSSTRLYACPRSLDAARRSARGSSISWCWSARCWMRASG